MASRTLETTLRNIKPSLIEWRRLSKLAVDFESFQAIQHDTDLIGNLSAGFIESDADCDFKERKITIFILAKVVKNSTRNEILLDRTIHGTIIYLDNVLYPSKYLKKTSGIKGWKTETHDKHQRVKNNEAA